MSLILEVVQQDLMFSLLYFGLALVLILISVPFLPLGMSVYSVLEVYNFFFFLILQEIAAKNLS